MIELIIALVVFGLIWYLVTTLPIPGQVKVVIQVLFVLILILLVLRMFGFVDVPMRLR